MKFYAKGEWEGEPDKEEFIWSELPCIIRRHPTLGHLCGYVGVPPSHPYYNSKWKDIDIEVHGGLTYGKLGDNNEGFLERFKWFGFDCAHYGDYCPPTKIETERINRLYPIEGVVYRNWSYTRREVEYMAKQLADAVVIPSYKEWLRNFA